MVNILDTIAKLQKILDQNPAAKAQPTGNFDSRVAAPSENSSESLEKLRAENIRLRRLLIETDKKLSKLAKDIKELENHG